jgi:hypothetical protein
MDQFHAYTTGQCLSLNIYSTQTYIGFHNIRSFHYWRVTIGGRVLTIDSYYTGYIFMWVKATTISEGVTHFHVSVQANAQYQLAYYI